MPLIVPLTNAPETAPIWDKGTFSSGYKSMKYHYTKEVVNKGLTKGNSIVKYTNEVPLPKYLLRVQALCNLFLLKLSVKFIPLLLANLSGAVIGGITGAISSGFQVVKAASYWDKGTFSSGYKSI